MKIIKHKKGIFLWLLTFMFIINLLPIYFVAKADSSTATDNTFYIKMRADYTYYINTPLNPSVYTIGGQIYSDSPIVSLKLCNLKNAFEKDILPYLTQKNKNIYRFKIPLSKVLYMFYSNNNISVGQYDMAIFCDNEKGQHIEKRFKMYIYDNIDEKLKDLFNVPADKTYLIYYKEPDMVKIDINNNIFTEGTGRDWYPSNIPRVWNNCYVIDSEHSFGVSYPTVACLPARYTILISPWSRDPFAECNNAIFYINIKALKDLNLAKIKYINNNVINIALPDDIKININKTNNKIMLFYKEYKQGVSFNNNIIMQNNDMFISIKLFNEISKQKILVLYDGIDPCNIVVFYVFLVLLIPTLIVCASLGCFSGSNDY